MIFVEKIVENDFSGVYESRRVVVCIHERALNIHYTSNRGQLGKALHA